MKHGAESGRERHPLIHVVLAGQLDAAVAEEERGGVDAMARVNEGPSFLTEFMDGFLDLLKRLLAVELEASKPRDEPLVMNAGSIVAVAGSGLGGLGGLDHELALCLGAVALQDCANLVVDVDCGGRFLGLRSEVSSAAGRLASREATPSSRFSY